MFKNAIIFRLNPDFQMPSAQALEQALGAARFSPCGPTQQESFGWVEPRGEKHGALVECVGGEYIFKLMTETKSVPGSVVKDRLAERCEKIEAETGRKPGSKEKKDLKEEIVRDLLPHAFPKKGATLLWVSPSGKFIVVDAGSHKKADRLTSQFIDALVVAGGSATIKVLQTNTSPSGAMAIWLTSKDAPAGFSVDRECELMQPDSEKSVVRYSRHTLDIDEVVEHITKRGKVPTKLAMTYEGRASFLLTEDMGLKKVELLDVALESAKDEAGFDTDVALVTGELSALIPALIEALDGELVLGAAAGEQAGGAATEPADHELREIAPAL